MPFAPSLPTLIQRIYECRDQVIEGLRRQKPECIQQGVDGIAVLIGKALTQLTASEDPNLLQQGVLALLEAQDAFNQGRDYLRHTQGDFMVDTSRPSEWISFDGEITPPLLVKPSSLPNAGDGLHTERAIKKGEVIAPIRVKIADTGKFFADWRKFPIAAMINHHPLPNLNIVRGNPPAGVPPMVNGLVYGETCYCIANRDISAGEELTSDYRDKGWAEWDYFHTLPLPFAEWDRNALRSMGVADKDLKAVVLSNPDKFVSSLGFVGGATLVYLASRSKGLPALITGTGGVLWTAYAVWRTHDEGRK
jgi:hypothetical protein